MIERTDPTDWSEMWAWIDGAWLRVRKVAATYYGQLIVEEYESVGKLYNVEMADCRRGDKPTEPPERIGHA